MEEEPLITESRKNGDDRNSWQECGYIGKDEMHDSLVTWKGFQNTSGIPSIKITSQKSSMKRAENIDPSQ